MIDSRRLPAFLPALLACVLLLMGMSIAHAREMVSVARSEVNMRSGPGTRHAAQWALSRGYPLTVVAQRGGWIQVSDFENDRGWLLRSLTNKTPHHIVKASIANLRSAPGTRTRIVGKASYGDVLRTLERRGDWVKVRSERGTTGWVARRLVWGW